MWSRNAAAFAETEWSVVVFDEAHKLKNPRAKVTKNAQLMVCKRRYALTGTPFQVHKDPCGSLSNVCCSSLSNLAFRTTTTSCTR